MDARLFLENALACGRLARHPFRSRLQSARLCAGTAGVRTDESRSANRMALSRLRTPVDKKGRAWMHSHPLRNLTSSSNEALILVRDASESSRFPTHGGER